MIAAPFPALLQRFFTDRLIQQRHASRHTIAGYRDTFRLLLRFAVDRLRRGPSALTMDDLTPAFVGEFLDHLERARGNSSRTRNARLAAIHSFAQYVALSEPAHPREPVIMPRDRRFGSRDPPAPTTRSRTHPA